ncbi:MAG: anaerobic ribonucleoside-triphosphate reductase activating protein [Chloroflexi bacterium]|nr:anaerobic ribonucleoside-triphosphate reductase activating protein [Chloroflexota bacterium]
MKIAGLQRVSLIDYPELIAATVFLAGCNLECGYCYNRWMIKESAVQEALSLSQLYAWLRTRSGKLQGVCISGGEPLIHAELPDMLQRIRQMGFRIKLDTNGTYPGRLQQVLDQHLIDYAAMDLKGPLDARYQYYTGVPTNVSTITASMQALRTSGVAYEFRTTVCPGLAVSDLQSMALAIEPQETWYLQHFQSMETVSEEWRNRQTLPLTELLNIAQILRERLPRVRVRGAEQSTVL